MEDCPAGVPCSTTVDMVLVADTGAVPAAFAVYMALTTSTFQVFPLVAVYILRLAKHDAYCLLDGPTQTCLSTRGSHSHVHMTAVHMRCMQGRP